MWIVVHGPGNWGLDARLQRKLLLSALESKRPLGWENLLNISQGQVTPFAM